MPTQKEGRALSAAVSIPGEETPPTVTAALARRLADVREAGLTPEAMTVAKQCLLDWLGVAIAAREEPLVRILVEELAPADVEAGCTLVGLGRRAGIDAAVLINGALSHALDFDDVILAMGHPSVPVAPVVLALAERLGASGADVIGAFVAGVEAESRVGALMGPSHYAAGWHGTGTYGAFGAMMAAATLLRLSEQQVLHAFGLAGTQAAGLKSVFGTMSKPLHAGKAAQNGLLAARLAARGFTSDVDILGSGQGFAHTQSTTVDVAAALAPRSQPYITDALFKYHAACYLTHNAIEAATLLRTRDLVGSADIAAVKVHVQATHLGVCNIPEPRTGLECKFSLRMTTALALAGEDTFQEGLFSDATARRSDLVRLCQSTEVTPTAQGRGSTVEVLLRDGRSFSRTADVAQPIRDLAQQQERLERKFRHLATCRLGEARVNSILAAIANLERAPDLHNLMRLVQG